MQRFKYLYILLFFLLLFISVTAFAEKKGKLPPKKPLPVSKNHVPSSTAHYMKARAYLIEAVREFDKGVEIENPSDRLNIKNFRNSLLDQAEALEKYLAPQAREATNQ